MPNNPQPIPAAAGYPQYSGTGFIPPIFSERMMSRFYCEAITPSITTSDYIGELKGRGDQLIFYRQPLINVRDYTKDMTIEADTLELEPVVIGINKAKYWAVKVDDIDRRMSQMWDTALRAAQEQAMVAIKQAIDTEILAFQAVNAHPNNQGPNAGLQSGAYNLGQVSAPVNITTANITEVLTYVSGVLDEQCVPQNGRFIVLPPIAKTYILNSQLSNASFYGGNGTSILLNGRLPMQIAGFDIYITQHLQSAPDPVTNQLSYNIVAGIKEATGFAMLFEEQDTKDGGWQSWSTYYRGRYAYGYDVLRPEGLARLYATFV